MANKKSKARTKVRDVDTVGGERPPKATPRLYPRVRLLNRFYEPLVLLSVLGRTRGEHLRANLPRGSNLDQWSIKHVRRLFLFKAAYLCDFRKGGDTVTAMAIEGRPEGKIIWVASNTSPEPKIIPFMQELLSRLSRADETDADVERRVDDAAKFCIGFASHRIKNYASFICSKIEKCKSLFERRPLQNSKYMPLFRWLENFMRLRDSYFKLCRFAYDQRRCGEMKLLEELCKEPDFHPDQDSFHFHFKMLRHYVGRLGHHIKAVKMLVLCMPRLSNLFDGIKIRPIPTPSSFEVPLTDDMTNIDRIVIRLLPSGSEQVAHYQRTLQEMDTKFKVMDRFMEKYQDPNLKPRVHAEVQVAAFFENRQLRFEDSDPFIASSKPSCYCCFLYFRRHHPNFVTPPAHQNIHLNWGLPDFQDDIKQRDILNSMIPDIRRDLLDQIDQKQPNLFMHPDSTTGITESLMDLSDEAMSVLDSDDSSVFDRNSDSESIETSSRPLNDDEDITATADWLGQLQVNDDDGASDDNWQDSSDGGGVPL
ncbi:hypothetical protein, variant [Verruconis gallopava]|uniref:Uncharacterized protein n=1 Tax=Verruconis gallopava TaxID=253628 RepID=A0A0D1XMG0_9PEZI|nr:hypothetical protein, variant [Verruconis gallopava]KIW03686.1 hypothetical protein, variant [Verruconis gallopava]